MEIPLEQVLGQSMQYGLSFCDGETARLWAVLGA